MSGCWVVEARSSHHWMDHYNVGIALIEHERRDSAETHLRRAAELNAGELGPLRALCDLLLDTDRPLQAFPFCRRAVQADPESAAAHFGFGSALEAMGRAPEAIRHYQQAARLAPEAGEPRGALRRLGVRPGADDLE